MYDQYLASQIISNDNLTQTINTKTTDYMATVQTDDIAMSGNGFKSASSKVSDITLLSNEYREQLSLYATSQDNGTVSTPQTSTVTFDKTLLDDTYDRISLLVDNNVVSQEFDTDADTTLKKLSDKISALQGFSSSVVIDPNTGELTGGIEIEYLVPGEEFLIGDAKINDTSFDINTTAPVAGSGLLAVQSVRDSLKEAVENAGGEFLEITNSVVHTTGTDMPAISSLQLKLDELGLSDRPFGDDIEVDSDGMIYVKQDDYRYVIGKVSTARFNDNNGLEPLGNNVFGKTAVDYLSSELLGYKAQLGVNGTFGLKLALEIVSGGLCNDRIEHLLLLLLLLLLLPFDVIYY
jgi:flagellar hook protein FlgE